MPTVGAVRQVALSAGRDLDRTLAFWHDVLGMSVHARYDPPGIAFIIAGGVRLFFGDGVPPAPSISILPASRPSMLRRKPPVFLSPRRRRWSIATPRAGSVRRGKANGWPF